MKCKFINVLMFAAGAAIGSAVTWKVVKAKYEKIAQEEIDSVTEAFADRLANLQEQIDDYVTVDEAEEWKDRASKIDWNALEDLDEDEEDDEDDCEPDDYMNDYARLVNDYTGKEGGAEDMAKEPYVISPYDFGELDGYSQVELTYYADGTLEDDEYNIVTDADELIGKDSLNTFGEYEDDAVFVRNERLRADFQILKDYRTYEEAKRVGPDQVDDE